MDNAGNQGLEAEFVEYSDEEEMGKGSMDFQTGPKVEEVLTPSVDRDTKLRNFVNEQNVSEHWYKKEFIYKFLGEMEKNSSSASGRGTSKTVIIGLSQKFCICCLQ